MNFSCGEAEGRAVIGSHDSALMNGAVSVPCPGWKHVGASSFPLLTAWMGYVLSNMHANWVSEGGRRAERWSILWCILTWIFFFNLAAWHFPMLKGSQILTHIFLLTIFLHRKVLLSANNWLQCISFSKINITQLIYKQHDAFKLRDGWQGQQVRALAKTYLTPCDCFADPRGRLPTFLTQPHYQSTDSNAHQVCLCLLHPNPRTSGLSDRGGRRCAGSLCTK